MTRYVQKATQITNKKNNYLAIYTNKTNNIATLTKQYTLTKQNNQLATPNKNEYN